jgi:ferredoxin
MRIIADRDRCVGSGQCVLTEPNVFDQDEEDGIVELLVERPDADSEKNARQAVQLCPSQALSISEE